jgi:hypothetical protein
MCLLQRAPDPSRMSVASSAIMAATDNQAPGMARLPVECPRRSGWFQVGFRLTEYFRVTST